jgi:hypothetical protein
MTPPFLVRTTPHYERLARKLLRQHPEFSPIQERALAILGADPMNRTRNYHIKKLEGVAPDDGQWRLSLGRWRFRYELAGREVVLKRCGLRREDTYRER